MNSNRRAMMVVWIGMLAAAPCALVRSDSELPKHITPDAQKAIDRGLKYLVMNQGRDGAWRNEGRYGRYPIAMTALAGIAILMDGNTTTQGRYSPNIDRTARYILDSATPTGLICRGTEEQRMMFGHGYSLLFLGELLGMTEDSARERQMHDILTRAIELTGRAQSQLGGWIYTPNSGGDEGAVTITQVQGLRSCRNAGVAVPKKVIDDAMGYITKSVNSDGGILYRANQPGPSRPPITAAAVCCWFNAGEYDNPFAKKALEFAKENIPVEAPSGHWYYAHLYLAQALYLSGDEDWDGYFPRIRDRLLLQQREDGAWDDGQVGSVFSTAVALIILQLPYNQLPIMQR